MKIAVYGASGYTGRLVAAELHRRDIEIVLCGRDGGRLRRAAGEAGITEAELRPAGVEDPPALIKAFGDCGAVINCAGPFAFLGEPVVRAAISAGCHYVDTTGEQPYIKRIFDGCARDAERAGVTVIPGAAVDGLPGDLIAHLAAERVKPVDELTLSHRLVGYELTRGSLHSLLEVLQGADLGYEDREWRTTGPKLRRPSVTFPDSSRPTTMLRAPVIEVVTVPRHVAARRVDAAMNADGLGPAWIAPALPTLVPVLSAVLRTPLRRAMDRLIDRLPEGPPEDRRRAASFTFVADATGTDGRRARGVVQGTDAYGLTAVIAVEGARRLVADGAPAGVLAPAQGFEPADFLEFLAPHGVGWNVEAQASEDVAATT